MLLENYISVRQLPYIILLGLKYYQKGKEIATSITNDAKKYVWFSPEN